MGETVRFHRRGTGGTAEKPVELPESVIPGVARICALGLGLPELLDEICREVAAAFGTECCCLVAIPAGGAPVEVRRFPGGGETAGLRDVYRELCLREEILSRLRDEGPLAVPDLSALSPDDPVRALFEPASVRSLLVVPLRIGTALNGLLAFHAIGSPRSWEDGERRLAEEAAPILAAALERKTMEERLLASEARYRFLADNALDFISLHDLEGSYLYASPASRRMLGYRPEEMTGVAADAFHHPDDLPKLREGNRRLAAGEGLSVTVQHRLRCKDGSFREVETVSSPVTVGGGEVRRILRITRDITERKQMESRIFEGQQQETIALLAGGVAHEFNNLLVGINGTAEMLSLLLSGNEEALQYLSTIERLGNRAVELTRQLLAYARQGVRTPELLSLPRLVTEDFPALRAALPSSVEIRLELDEGVPPVRVDLFQLKQVIVSLCLNAAEAMPCGGTLTIRTRQEDTVPEGPRDATGPSGDGIERRLFPGGEFPGPWTFLEVADSGAGMEEATLKRIFEPFFSTKFIGRGMGLAAVRGIVENHGGAIRVYTEPGKGTVFSIGFPGAEGTPAAEEPREPPPLCGEGTILLADDEEDVRDVVRAMLESFGYTVVTARDGQEAVEIFRERAGEVDLVLLDMMMPRMTGAEAFAEIRRISPGARAILASGYDVQGAGREFASRGFSAFLQKPFRRGELGRKVGEALGSGSRGTSGES